MFALLIIPYNLVSDLSKYFQHYARYRIDKSKTLSQSVHIPTLFIVCNYDNGSEICLTSDSDNISWTGARLQVLSNEMCPLNLVWSGTPILHFLFTYQNDNSSHVLLVHLQLLRQIFELIGEYWCWLGTHSHILMHIVKGTLHSGSLKRVLWPTVYPGWLLKLFV